MLQRISEQLIRRLQQPLPGNNAHLKMAHQERLDYFSKYRIPDNARISSVLMLLYEKDEKLHLPLIVRANDGTVHSGQISLPGGSIEPDDEHLAFTAVRETEEEIGIPRKGITVLGRLSQIYIPPSNFLVHPFIGKFTGAPVFSEPNNEVAQVLEVCIEELFDENKIQEKTIVFRNGKSISTPAYVYDNHIIWGATAMMLSELRMVLTELT
jgi:8-oxo-dGTP pyrophosphatase MutT (NUDIX family)